MVSRCQQQRNILASRIASQGIVMVFSYTSCERLSKKCIVDPKNSNCLECAHYGHQCDVDRSVVLKQIDAEQSKLLTEAQKAEAEVSKLLL
jgi:hypothetical protein